MQMLPASIRALIALFAVVAVTAYATWIIRTAAVSRFKASTAGQIVEQHRYVAPQIERRDKEVDELTRP